MFQMTAKQKLLLKGIAELEAAIWTLDHSDTFTPNDHNRLVILRRANKALLRDALQQRQGMTPADGRRWADLMMFAGQCCNTEQAAAFARALELRFDPSSGEVARQETLWGDGS